MKNLLFALVLALSSSSAFAYYGTMDTGDVLPSGKYRAMVGPQFVMTGENDGLNVTGRFDAGVTKSSNLRGLIGTGKTDFFSGLFYKWVPIPDFEKQPAVGIMSGFLYSRQGWEHIQRDVLDFRVHPIISKQMETNVGIFTPYGSLPLGMTFVDGTTVYPVQLVGGTEFKPYSWENISFFGELGLNVHDAFSYIEFSVAFYFDEAKK